MSKKLVFIGAGSMSEAILSGILHTGFTKNDGIYVTNKNNHERLEYLRAKYQIHCFKNKGLITDADIIILSTKPYDMKEAIEGIRNYVNEEQLVISVIAGKSTDYILELFNKDVAVIRAMPNTSASIGYSATAICKGKYVTEDQMDLAKSLFKTIGKTVSVDENAMHAVTSISGSGPAYIYYLVEAMEKAALDIGLNTEIAQQLIIQTVIGAGKMLETSGDSANVLRKKITSRAGTTEAGIETLNKYNFQEAVIKCVKNANQRSVELGKKE